MNRLCLGCRNDIYNKTGICWSLKTARVVQRTKVGTWDTPPYVWKPETTLSCHSPEGKHWLEKDDVRLVRDMKCK
jgi:hypothetical protein